jgi:hypothetical protein
VTTREAAHFVEGLGVNIAKIGIAILFVIVILVVAIRA